MTISLSNQFALEAEHSGRIYFIYLDFAGDPFYACTGTHTYAFDGNDYLGIGEVAGISDIADTADVAARPLTLTLSGVDAWITEPILSRTNYKGRDAVIYRGLLLPDGEMVDDPFAIWSGTMDVGSMSYDENVSSAQITCEPLSARLLRANVSRYSDEDHQLRHPSDAFFEFLAQMERKDVTWGGMRVSPNSGGGDVSGNAKQAPRQKN